MCRLSWNLRTSTYWDHLDQSRPVMGLLYLDYIYIYLLTYWLIYLLIYSIEQSLSWEANRFVASQEIPHVLLNPKVHYRIHNCSPPVYPEPAQSSPYPRNPLPDRSILLSSHLRQGLSSGLFPSGFPTKTLYTPLSFPIRATCPAHLILLDFTIYTCVCVCVCVTIIRIGNGSIT
jgi:hypothetical protein